jgi:hypothetical protein
VKVRAWGKVLRLSPRKRHFRAPVACATLAEARRLEAELRSKSAILQFFNASERELGVVVAERRDDDHSLRYMELNDARAAPLREVRKQINHFLMPGNLVPDDEQARNRERVLAWRTCRQRLRLDPDFPLPTT